MNGSGPGARRRAGRSPAIEGRANEALVEFVAEALGVPKRGVAVAAGERSRDKFIAIEGECDPARLLGGTGR